MSSFFNTTSGGSGSSGLTDRVGVAENLTTLAALSSASSGYIWINSLLCFWKRNTSSSLTPDGITVIAAVGGGNWEREISTTAPDWLSQATWYIDPSTGNDENIGSATAPLATFAELNRRLSVGGLKQDITVYVVAESVISYAMLEIDTNGYLFTIAGVPTTVRTGIVNTYTERSHITPEVSMLTDSGVADWIANVWQRIRITSGASAQSVAWVAATSPGGVGVNVAAVNRFGGVPAAPVYLPTIVSPAGTSTYVVESLPIIQNLSINQKPSRTPTSVSTQVAFLIKDLALGGVAQSRLGISTNIMFIAMVDGCSIDSHIRSESFPACNLTRCRFGGSANVAPSSSGNINFRDSLLVKSIYLTDDKTFNFYQSLAYGTTGGSGSITQGSISYGLKVNIKIYDSQIFNSASSAIDFILSGTIWTRYGMSGTRNLYGLLIGDSSDEALGEQSLYWSDASDKPNLLGTTASIRISGSTNIDLTWAQTPFNSNEQKGIGTLDDGYIVVSARNANSQGVIVSKATGIGVARGILEAPEASRTATNFLVQSVDLTGVIVSGDNSTFDWHIPGTVRRIILSQGNVNQIPI